MYDYIYMYVFTCTYMCKCMYGSVLYKENHAVEYSPLYLALRVHHENTEP